MDDKILLVDDEPLLLAGLRRRLGNHFDLHTATDPRAALDVLREQGPFAVVVADMNMPEMDGTTFLAEAAELAPDTVRMMLTGNAHLETAVRAVNEGSVFRFITKPCPAPDLARFLRAGLRQHALIEAERQNAALIESNRAKTNFLTTVSHELRTPLTIVQSSAELLRDQSDATAEEQAEFLGSILCASERLNDIVGRLLFLAQLDANLLRPEPRSFDLGALLVEFCDYPRFAGHVTLDNQCSSATAVADPNLLLRVLGELVDNAMAHAHTTTQRPATVRLSQPDEDSYQITVRDYGAGLPEHSLQRLFDPFVQCDEVLRDKPKGLGIGLTICSKILALHGGSVQSQVLADDETGSCMLISLPRRCPLGGEMNVTEDMHAC